MHAVLIWDGAGFHTSEDVVVPSNVSLIQLPPYSPELSNYPKTLSSAGFYGGYTSFSDSYLIRWRTCGITCASLVEPLVPGLRRVAGGGGQESVCGPRRHRNDQDRLQSSIYLKGRMKLPESVLAVGKPGLSA